MSLFTLAAPELIGRLSARNRIRDLAVREPDIEVTVRCIYEGHMLETEQSFLGGRVLV